MPRDSSCKLKMKKISEMPPYLLVNVLIFYLLPIVIINTGFAMFVMLVGIPALCFATAVVYGVKKHFQRIYPVLVAILFVPSRFWWMFKNHI